MFVNRSLELMQASFTLSQCVKICQQDCTRDGSLTLICRNSRLDIIELPILGICSCLSIKIPDQNIKLRAFLHLENRKKIDCYSVYGYCDHCQTVFEAMGCYYHFCSCQKPRPSLENRTLREETRRERWMICDEKTLKRKDTKWKECGSVTSGKNSKPMTKSKITSEPAFLIKDLFLQFPF